MELQLGANARKHFQGSIIDRTRAFGPGTIGAGGVPDFLGGERTRGNGARKRKEKKKKKRKKKKGLRVAFGDKFFFSFGTGLTRELEEPGFLHELQGPQSRRNSAGVGTQHLT